MTVATRPGGFRPLLPQRSTIVLDPAGQHRCADFEDPPKRTRVSVSRSRSGCWTCRARRVKCDETLPICARCVKANIRCKGYPQPAASSRQITGGTSVRLPPIAPKPTSPAEIPARLSRGVTGLPVIEGPDVIYFDYFRLHVVKELSSGHNAPLWSIAVSESLHDSCIRESALAIGALARAISVALGDHHSGATATIRRPSALAPWSPQCPANEHHHASLLHHLRAVSGFRTFMGKSTAAVEPRKGIIMTLMLIVYEMLQGHLDASDKILNCGLAVFRNSITFFRGTQAAGNGVEEIEHALPCLAVMGLFTRQYSSAHTCVSDLRAEPDFEFPNPVTDPVSKALALWGRFFTLATTCLGQIDHDTANSAFKSSARQAKFLWGLEEWKPRLEHYLGRSEGDLEGKLAVRLTLLHWDVIWISMKSSFDSAGLAFDAFTCHFRGLLRRCIEYIQLERRSDAPRLMTFGEGILMPLLCIVKCCRDHDLRMTAAAIAYEIPWREGTWDARIVLLGQLGAVSMEEKARDDAGVIPANARWHWRGGKVCTGTNKMVSHYVRYEDGKPCRQSLIIDLDRWPEICSLVSCHKDHTRILKTAGPETETRAVADSGGIFY